MAKPPYQPQHGRPDRLQSRSLLAGAVVVAVVAATGAWALSRHQAKPAHQIAAHHLSTSVPVPTSGVPVTQPGPAGIEASWVAAENHGPGTTAWQISGHPSGVIGGFADHTSAQAGDTVTLYVSTNAPTFHVEAYRMGYYGGAGGRLVWTSPEVAGHTQASCPVMPGTNMVTCDNWTPSLHFTVTASFVQGDYLLKLVGSAGQSSYIPLTVWDPASKATYLVENDIYTWQAWNPYGGFDFYQGSGSCAPTYPPCNRARVVSFDRPYGYGSGAADFLGLEYPLVRFVEEHGLDVTYATSADFEADPSFLAHHKAVLSLGHDECWSLGERRAAQAAKADGVNIVFFGASPILRHVRLQASPLGPLREEVDYRDSAADPLDGHGDPLQVTGNTWSSPPANSSEVPFVGANYTGYTKPGEAPVPLVVADASAWLFSGTGLRDGSTVAGLLWSDFDQFDPGLSPRNTEILTHSPMPLNEVQTNVSAPASDTTYYTDPTSGAGVFDTGTVTWIIDMPAHPIVDQMTANLLALFGHGPAGRTQPSVANWQHFYP